MRRSTLLFIGSVCSAALLGAATSVSAGHGKDKMKGMSGMKMSDTGSQSGSDGQSMPMMKDMSAMMKNMGKMMQMMGGDNSSHSGGSHGPSHFTDIAKYDTDHDGDVSSEEMHDGLLAEMTAHDKDADSALSLAEFEDLHAARIRNKMVDHFQHLDEDGDGSITEHEMTAPARKLAGGEMKMKHSPASE